MANDKFSIKEALNYGWAAFQRHWLFFVVMLIVAVLCTVLPTAGVNALFGQRGLGHNVGIIVVRLIGLIVGMFITRIALDVYDRDATAFPAPGTLLALFPSFLIGRILYILILMSGSIFFIIPALMAHSGGGKMLYGILLILCLLLLLIPAAIWGYMFLYSGFLIIDRGVGPIESLKESKEITYGYKVDLFLFTLVTLLINLGGLLCLGVGVFVTAPVTMMASVYVYRHLAPPAVIA